jgi:lipopolysaccharide biosynthesis glycosyltransferase
MPENPSSAENAVTERGRLKANIVFATDRLYAPHLAAALCSLFENNRDLAIDAYILHAELDQPVLDKLAALANKYGQRIIDLKVIKADVEGLVTTFHFTLANYFRLFIPEKLPFERALYLDSDVIVNGSIRELYLTELGDYYLAAVREAHFDRHLQLEMSEDAAYFNSGVMLMNLNKWRTGQVKERVIEFVKRKPEAIEFVDQCGTNSVINGRWKSLHPKYNFQTSFLKEDYIPKFNHLYLPGELSEAVSHPVIIHYTGSTKPWLFRQPHPYRHLYWRYSRKTPFKQYLPEGLTLSRALKWIARNTKRLRHSCTVNQ